MQFRRLPLALAIPAALFSLSTLSAFAADGGDRDTADDLDAVVVTATRTAVTVDASLAPVSYTHLDVYKRQW